MTKTNNTKADKANESNLDPLAFIDRVRVAQEEWNEKMFQGTNARLLSLLADCHAVYDALTAAGVTKRKAFTAKLAKEGLTYKEGVHLSTKIVHYVFRTKNARTTVYARVLRAVISNKVEADKLSAWVTEQGGIEAVRRQNADKPNPAQLARELGKRAQDTLAQVTAQAVLKDVPASLVPSNSEEHELSVALVRMNSVTKKLEVVWGCNTASVVRLVLNAVGKQVIEKHGDVKAAQDAQAALEHSQQTIENAVNGNTPSQQQAA
jgi:hypothetical protein